MTTRARCFNVITGFLILSGSVSAPIFAEDLTPKQRDLFEIKVRPVLMKHCIRCHGEERQRGGLRLNSKESLLKGGKHGPAIVPGASKKSLLTKALHYDSLEMPPSGKLAEKDINGIVAWIDAGAPWPKDVVLSRPAEFAKKDREWWCYQPIGNPTVPKTDVVWCRNEIDHFILDRLRRAGLSPSKEAEPSRLLRRAHFALTGLPPDDKQLSIVNSKSEWYELLVDRLLESSAYGENQARYWLDLFRYADSDGYNADHARPEAYHYRDYVIRSFNADKPYNRFVLEQLAGDEIDPGNRDALIATMYLRHWIYEGQWQEILSDVTETTADVFLAQGLKCARCHDHKFDPLLQKDYYRMKAFFAPLLPREDQPIADVATRTKHLKQQRAWEEATKEIRNRLHAIESPVLLKNATREGFDKFTKEIRSMISKQRQRRGPYEHQIASLASLQFDLHPEKLPKWLDKKTEAERQRLRKELARYDHLKPKPLPTLKFVASDVGPVAPPTTIPDSDDPTPIAPGFPTILDANPAKIQSPPTALRSTGRRTALARWIVDPKNPLTARVIVNRIWQQHFGRGLVETTSDFGRLGTPPSHPKLLDWLARRFMKDGWSLKKLHRLILTSATYRQSSLRPMNAKLRKLDPQNILLWRMNPRRLFGEEIHDCFLAASGELTSKKRAIYKSVKRNKLDPLLAVLDFPDRVRSQGKRHSTTTSPQALLLMNEPWLRDRARALAKKIGETDIESFVRTAYRRLYFREPSREEIDNAIRFYKSYRTEEKVETPRLLTTLPGGKSAIRLSPESSTSIQIPTIKSLQSHSGDFTLEAVVLLRSLYRDATVRTIAAGWTGSKKDQGWALGVTSTRSAFKPRNLILQFVGTSGKSKLHYEVVASNLRPELNKPYYLAVSVKLSDTSKKGVTFYLKDLSKPGAKMQTASVAHRVKANVHADRPIEIGGRSNRHLWDGLIHNLRMHDVALSREQLLARPTSNLLFDIRFEDEKKPGEDVSMHKRHAVVRFNKAEATSPEKRARLALLHALLCSNEVIYVD